LQVSAQFIIPVHGVFFREPGCSVRARRRLLPRTTPIR
jgi:hypothetical protein